MKFIYTKKYLNTYVYISSKSEWNRGAREISSNTTNINMGLMQVSNLVKMLLVVFL